MRREWFLLVVVNSIVGSMVWGCTRTPTTEQICAHYQALDDAAPMLHTGNAPARPSSKVASCTRQLTRLHPADPVLYDAVSKCVMDATSSKVAWDCWVGSHVSRNDPTGTAAYLACDQACDKTFSDCQTACIDGKIEVLGNCTAACVDTNDQCATACAFP